jgi:hypothetical protein
MYSEEFLDESCDDGTMPDSKAALEAAVVGRRIVAVENVSREGWSEGGITITLDNGTKAEVRGSGDCCAYTDIEDFFLSPDSVDHVITGVGTTNGYTTWHIYADMGDVLKLSVDWSCGNPFYYGYGFKICVRGVEA